MCEEITMQEPRLRHVQCLSARGLHRMAYWEWGDPRNARVLVCVHGLSRQGRDFDALAQAMSGEFRVVCPDVVGRGQSDWLADPMAYNLPTYVADMVTLIARLDTEAVHWVGTSMGGLIGLGLTSLPKSPVVRLVLNDIGPTLQAEALKRIGDFIGITPRWATADEAANYLQTISMGFGPHSREAWLALSLPQIKPDADGFTLRRDPGIAAPFRAVTPEAAAAGEAMLWYAYDAIGCPTLLLRGADSDLLSVGTAQAMTQRGPKARLHEFAGIGHAPMVNTPDQIAVVREFLLAP
jgi:pimeloyl-ACP methyl ester carboxylesterase